MVSKMLTTTCFLVMSGYKFGLAHKTHFLHPDWVCTDWFRQFTASQPFQSFTISISNWLDKVEIWIHGPQPSPHLEFWVEGGENFALGSLRFTPRLSVYRLIQPFHISPTHPISHHKYNEGVIQGWDWYVGTKMVTTTCFLVMSWYKFGLAQTHFTHPDWVCTGWFRQFTAPQPFQPLTISILNG